MSTDLMKRDELLSALDQEMRKVSAQSVLFSQAVAEQLGINSTDLECLDIINFSSPITAGRLADLTGLTTGAITGVIDRLEKVGYVRRERDPNDRRRVIIQPLSEAAQKISPLFDSMAQAMSKLYSSYSDQEIALILDFATRSNSIVLEEIAKLQGKEEAGEN